MNLQSKVLASEKLVKPENAVASFENDWKFEEALVRNSHEGAVRSFFAGQGRAKQTLQLTSDCRRCLCPDCRRIHHT